MADDYPVGYRKPPRATRFKPGQSGNAKGRPKGAKNFSSALEKELSTRVPVVENGQRRLISKREAIAKQLVNKAAAGDQKAIPVVLAEARTFESPAGSGGSLDILDQAEDQMVMTNILARFRQMDSPLPPPEPTQEADPPATPVPEQKP